MYNQDYSTQQSYLRIKGQINSFPGKKKLKKFNTTKPALQEILKGLLGKKVGGEKRRKRS